MKVNQEILKLEEVFSSEYNFSVERYEIPSGQRAHSALALKILQFADYHEEDVDGNSTDTWGRENVLKIVYYGGHGFLDQNRLLCWCNRSDNSDGHYFQIQWSGIQSTLVASGSDVLIILDCCASGVAAPSLGNGATELIAACGFHEHANAPGPASFTEALIKELKHMRYMTFTAAELYIRILSRIHKYMPDMNGVERMKAPIHAILKHHPTNIYARSISLSAIRPSIPPTEVVQSPAPKLSDEVWDSMNHPPGAPSPASLLSSMSSFQTQLPTFMLSIKVKGNQDLESLSDAVADWIKAVPVSAESINFEAAYRSFSTLLIISMPAAMWCYFKRHPAITCLGIVMPAPKITGAELCFAVNKKLTGKRKPSPNVDMDCFEKPLLKSANSELNWYEQQPSRISSSRNKKVLGIESKGRSKPQVEAYDSSSIFETTDVSSRSGSLSASTDVSSHSGYTSASTDISSHSGYTSAHPVTMPYVTSQFSYNLTPEQSTCANNKRKWAKAMENP